VADAKTYILLAIGDALVAQLPLADAVDRRRRHRDARVVGQGSAGQIGSQFARPRPGSGRGDPACSACCRACRTSCCCPPPGSPGSPHGSCARSRSARSPPPPPAAEPVDPSRIGWDEVIDGMQVHIDIGYGLVPLVDERRGAR
jgi:flagellar biosynthesis protein FlhA